MAEHQSDLITVYRCGVKFTASRRTVQHLDYTLKRLKRFFPWARLVILQPCYNTGVEASAGTHDFDAVLDVRIIGLTWRHGQRFLRNCGWAAFWRHTGSWADKHAWHIHMASLPPGVIRRFNADQVGHAYKAIGIKVGEFIDGGTTSKGHTVASSQIVDYLAMPPRDALADHGPDPTYHPANIAKTIYHYDPKQAA